MLYVGLREVGSGFSAMLIILILSVSYHPCLGLGACWAWDLGLGLSYLPAVVVVVTTRAPPGGSGGFVPPVPTTLGCCGDGGESVEAVPFFTFRADSSSSFVDASAKADAGAVSANESLIA